MKVLVTGGTGFLGGHLLSALTQDDGAGHDVVALVRQPTDHSVPTLVGDVLEPPNLEGFDAVIHCAGAVSHHPDDALNMNQVHVEGTQNMLTAAIEGGVKRFVHLSSSGTVAVSKEAKVIDETGEEPLTLVSTWPYYRAKLFSERLVQQAQGIDTIILNPSLLLGPGDQRGAATNSIRLFLDGWITMSPPGGLSFVDVRDVAEMCVAALDVGEPGQRYLLGAANWTFHDFYSRLARLTDHAPPMMAMPKATRKVLEWLPNLGREEGLGLVRKAIARHDFELACVFWWLNDAKAREQLGWSPRDPTETLADTVADLQTGALQSA